MKSVLLGAASAIVFAFVTPVLAEAPVLTETLGPRYAIALYGDLKYPQGFTHFEYVNPNAPKGGAVKLAETGSFDSVNPFILKGVKAPGLATVFDSLMVQSQDEPQSMYGLIAESVTLAPDNSYAEFTLRPQARWHDGTPITADDVVFSFHTLKDKGDPTYKIMYTPIIACEKTGERSVKFTFNDTKNRELPMLAGAMPVISKAYYSKQDFEKTTLEPPLGSGAYKIESVDPGRAIVYARVKDYWAQDLAVNKGQNNFDTIRYDLYRDENVSLEGLKAGEYDFRREYIARNWATAYDTPAVRDGRVVKREIPDYTPQGMQSFIFNTRKAKFADRRVREAISRSMDFEWQNKTIFYGAYVRNKSFFENTEFQSKGAPAGKELELLSPFATDLPAGTLEHEFANPVTDGQGNARESLLIAQKLLEDAGYMIKDGKRVDAKGEQLSVEFMLRQPTLERVIGPMRKNLERLGIASAIRIVDDSQYQKRTDESDFDVVSIWINRGLFFPGNEQMALWHSSQADVKGSNNLGGVKNKVVDAMLESLTNAQDKESLVAAGRALDRVLLSEHYVIPHWHSGVFRVAYWNKFGMPDISPKYNLGFQTWWVK
jgi:microcin C transport system substrate-binding protein